MVSTASIMSNISQHTGKKSMLKGLLAGGTAATLTNLAFLIPDYLSVPSAFKLEYDTDGNKVEGTNHESGWKEIGKCAVKSAAYLVVPAVIGGALATLGLSVIGSIATGFAIGAVVEKLLPNEHKLVSEACEKKGIDYKAEAPNLFSFLA